MCDAPAVKRSVCRHKPHPIHGKTKAVRRGLLTFLVRYNGVEISFIGPSAQGSAGAADVIVKAGARVRTTQSEGKTREERSFATNPAILRPKNERRLYLTKGGRET